MIQGDFKKKYTFEERYNESRRILDRYPDRIPIIVEVSKKSKIPTLEKRKYLVPNEMTIGQFIFVLRKHTKLSAEQGLYLFINNIIPHTAALLSTVYDDQKDKDGFLYCVINTESVYG